MSRYVVRVVGPAGCESYLFRGREVGMEHATRYDHPSAARKAGESFRGKRCRQWLICDVIDTRDPERTVAS